MGRPPGLASGLVFLFRLKGFSLWWLLTFIFFTMVAASFSVDGRFSSCVEGGAGAWYGILRVKMASPGAEKAPASEGHGATFLDYEHQAHLWMRATKTELAARVLHMHMQPAPRQVCPAQGGDILGRGDGVTRISDILRSYFAPGAADAIHQQVMRFTNYRGSGQFH